MRVWVVDGGMHFAVAAVDVGRAARRRAIRPRFSGGDEAGKRSLRVFWLHFTMHNVVGPL